MDDDKVRLFFDPSKESRLDDELRAVWRRCNTPELVAALDNLTAALDATQEKAAVFRDLDNLDAFMSDVWSFRDKLRRFRVALGATPA
jgi:hypothetical protein